MNSFKTCILTIISALLLLAALHAQTPARRNARPNSLTRFQLTMPPEFQGAHMPLSGEMRFLASEEGRAFLKATGHPLAQYAIARWGEPSKTTVVPAQWLQQAANARQPLSADPAPPAPCNASNGVRFNLEPRANAMTQNEAIADFLPNRIGAGNDLIVQAASDDRGNFPSKTWDNSLSGYYVHTSTNPDCSVQFEGGLPSFTFQGSGTQGVGRPTVAADPARDAFFMADVRVGGFAGDAVGLFRASASTLLDPKSCPSGSHLEKQAESCWMKTPPVLLRIAADTPRIAVDERPTKAGVGAGDVYIVADALSVTLTPCTNGLNCGQPLVVSGSDFTQMSDAQVRADGLITISYMVVNSDGTPGADVKFVTCTPSGAPKAPVCGTPVLVIHLANNLLANFFGNTLANLVNYSSPVSTFPKITNRVESGNHFTTFLVYDDCKDPFRQNNASVVCINAEVMLATSTDSGKTWSTPVSVDTTRGHHFLPAITTDTSTGIVHIAYYSAEGDKFNHEIRVFRNQINAGGLKLGPPQAVTQFPDTLDNSFVPSVLPVNDLFMSAKARGNGTSGKSRLYMSFDSALVDGIYEGRPVPDANNSIIQVSY
jgi:hypothetical protein